MLDTDRVAHSTSPLGMDCMLVRDESLPAAEIDGDLVLLSLRAGCYFELDRVALEIWNVLASPCRAGQLVDDLLQHYDVDSETLHRNVILFLRLLLREKLIRPVDPKAPQ